jgi:hypothetical protein
VELSELRRLYDFDGIFGIAHDSDMRNDLAGFPYSMVADCS